MRSRAWFVAALAGCGVSTPDGVFGGGDATEAETSAAASSGSTALADDGDATDEGESSESGSTGVVKYDVGGDTDGEVQCECGSQLDFSYVWVANSGQSTISKINTQTLTEEGRYLTRPDGHGDPSRTSVSLSGLAVAVANRNGGVTKVWAAHDRCDPASNGEPGLQTSGGAADVRSWGDDDCVAWFADFPFSTQRPIAWVAGETDPATCEVTGERLWTSGCNKFADSEITVHRLDGDTGAVLDTVPVPGFACIDLGGYGGAADRDGNFWVTSFDIEGLLARIDAATLEVELHPTPSKPYGVTVDAKGRPWIACTSGDVCSAARFDPMTQTWALADDHLIASQSGIVIDAHGRAWMNWWWYDETYGSGIAAIDVETMAVGEPIVTPAQAKGIAVDLDGYVWSVAPQTNSAYRIDPDTGDVATVDGLSNPYTYSDMTGWALQNATCTPAG